MKTIFYTAALALLTVGAIQGQEGTSVVEKTKTTRTTVKSSLGNETVTKKETTTAITPSEFKKGSEGDLNQVRVPGQTLVRTTTTYMYDDSAFSLEETPMGYNIMRLQEDTNESYGSMRKLSRGDVYMMKTDDGISVGYFDEDGNMVSEKYNSEDDTITTVVYKIM